MADFTTADRAADAAYELATSPRDELSGARAELNDIWRSGNLPAQEIGQSLEENNLLAPLALYDSENLDTDGNESLEYGELLSVAGADSSDTLTKNLAEHLASEVAMRDYAPISISELRSMGATPTDPIPGEMDFDPATVSDGEVGKDELAYAYENFGRLDADGNDYTTSEEIDSYLSESAGSLSEADAAKLRDLSSQVGNLEENSNDEIGDENDGYTRADLEAAAADLVPELNADRASAGEDATTAESILDSSDDAEERASDALAQLRNADSSTEDQLAAIKTMVEAGQTTATITDTDGNSLNVRLVVEPISEGSDRSYVQMFAVDESGNESVVLRAISQGDSFSQQRDGNGNLVSYVGSKWQKNHPDSLFGEE